MVLRGSLVDDIEPDDGDGGHDARAKEDRGEGGKEQKGALKPAKKVNSGHKTNQLSVVVMRRKTQASVLGITI